MPSPLSLPRSITYFATIQTGQPEVNAGSLRCRNCDQSRLTTRTDALSRSAQVTFASRILRSSDQARCADVDSRSSLR